MYKIITPFLFFFLSNLFFSYGLSSESGGSDLSVVSEFQPRYKFSDRKLEMTVLEALHRASGNHELNGLRLLCDQQRMFSQFRARSATQEDINSFFDGHTPLMRAVYKGVKRIKDKKIVADDVSFVVAFLLEKGASINLCDSKKRNVLMYAAQGGCGSKLFKLLASSAAREDFNMQDVHGNTVVHYAIRSPQLLDILKESGAIMTLKNKKNLSPLEVIATRFIADGDRYKKIYQASIQILGKK